MYDFNYVCASSIEEAAKALGQEGAQIISGGQTLIPTLKQRLANPTTLVSVGSIEEIKRISVNAGGVMTIGAAATHNQVCLQGIKFPALAGLNRLQPVCYFFSYVYVSGGWN